MERRWTIRLNRNSRSLGLWTNGACVGTWSLGLNAPDTLHRVAAQQPAAHQRQDQVHGRAVGQPGDSLELAALDVQAGHEQVEQGTQGRQATAVRTPGTKSATVHNVLG